MKKITIIDGTSLLYSASYNIGKSNTNDFTAYTDALKYYLDSILIDTEADYRYFILDGKKPTFRKLMYPSYKANRNSSYFKFIKDLNQFAIHELGAIYTEGLEADDIVRIYAELYAKEMKVTVAYLDKDLLQFPCIFYNYRRHKKNLSIKEATSKLTQKEANYNFCYQLMRGDSVDNIQGLKNCGDVTATNYLKDLDYADLPFLLNHVKKAYLEGINLTTRKIKPSENGLYDYWKTYNLIRLIATEEEAGFRGFPIKLVSPVEVETVNTIF